MALLFESVKYKHFGNFMNLVMKKMQPMLFYD